MVMQLDGQPIDAEAAMALGLYNYGHFTSMLVNEQRVKGLELHLARLARDCQTLFDAALDVVAVRQYVRIALAEVAQPVVARVTIFDPGIELGRPSKPAEPRVLVTARPVSTTPPPPLKLRSVQYERESATVKHVGLFGTLHHRRQAQLAGYDDVLFIDASGHCSEGATWNIAFYDDGEVIWPKAECLPGTAMQLMRDCLRQIGIPYADAPVEVSRARAVQAAFATNAVVGVRPIQSIDDVQLPGNPEIVSRLRDAYAAIPGTPL